MADVIYDACAVKLPLKRVRADVKEADSAGTSAPKQSALAVSFIYFIKGGVSVSKFLKKNGHTFKE